MGLFDDVLDLRGILGSETIACEKCREERNERVEMEATTTWSQSVGEVTSYECPKCGAEVLRAPDDDGPQMVGGVGESSEWRDASPGLRGRRRR